MFFRRNHFEFICILFLLRWVAPALADFDCHPRVGNHTYDLTPVEAERTITRERSTPPTREVDSVRFSLCADLKKDDKLSANDQCPPGTRVCLTKINRKPDTPDRITSVVPLAQSDALNPSLNALQSARGLSILLHGSTYPHPINVTDSPQSVNITLLCDPTNEGEPVFKSYDGARLELEWSTRAGCGFKSDNGGEAPPDHEEEKEDPKVPASSSGLSSVGWFLLLLVIAFAAYMGFGAYYNYTNYGSRGLDLIPHRDFWNEVPYMFKDVISHLCVRPRRSASRGGYVAV